MHRLAGVLAAAGIGVCACANSDADDGTFASGIGSAEGEPGSSGATESSTSSAGTFDTSAHGVDTASSDGAPGFDVGAGDETGDGACELDDVPDTHAFEETNWFETGIPDEVLQASFYDSDRGTVTVMSFSGSARTFELDGSPHGDVFPVPDEALPSLDGAVYDPLTLHALLINQGCMLVEVDVATWTVVGATQLDFGMQMCAGIAIGLDGNLYVTSYLTQELVVVSRDGLQEIKRTHTPDSMGLGGPDGISLIAGSRNFLVLSTYPSAQAAIIAWDDDVPEVIVPTADLGQVPLTGGAAMLPDASLTICANGHAWVCEAYDGSCFDYAPVDGDKEACGCLVPAM